MELRAEGAGPAHVVIGIGINCTLGAEVARRVRATGVEPVDLASLGVLPCDRNRLVALMLDHLVRGVLEFEQAGLAAFAAAWTSADALVGRVVTVKLADGEFVGHARGIDADGALCVQGVAGLQRFSSGDVSVRPQQ